MTFWKKKRSLARCQPRRKSIINENIEKYNEELENKIVPEQKSNEIINDEIVVKLKNEIKDYSEQLQNYSKIVDTQERVFKEYKNQFSILKKNLNFEKNAFGKSKVIIELTQEEVENIFNIIDIHFSIFKGPIWYY